MIRLEKMALAYGEQRVLRDCSLCVEEGERVALMGASGCGKTTMLQVVAGLLSTDAAAVNGTVSYVFQEPALFPWLTAAENVNVVLGDSADTMSEAQDWLTAVGLADCCGKYPHQLSGGQRQRAIIASAMISRPKLLVCDEPTTALDVTVQKQILELLYELSEKHNVGILLISHDLTVVRRLCENVAVMYKGQIVEQGSTEEIFHNPKDEYTKRLIAAIPKRKRHDGN